MFSAPVPARWPLAALTAAFCGQYWLTDFRPSQTLSPAHPIRADMEDEIVFRNPSASEGPAIIADIERSTNSDFSGMLVDLEDASISNVAYGVSQHNTPVRFSTVQAHHAEKGTCRTFFEVSLPEHSAADSVAIRGKTLDGGDRTGKSGNFEFDLRSSNSTAKLSITLDPGETGAPEDCQGEFWVGETRYPVGALNPVTFQITAGKRATFRFSKPPATASQIRLTSGFDAAEVIIRGPDGSVRSRYSTAARAKPISVQELALNPGTIECSLLGHVLWSDARSRHFMEWAGQNPVRLALYGVVDLILLVLTLRRRDGETIITEPIDDKSPLQGPYVFISYEHSDGQLAGHIANRLRAAGVIAWLDRDLKPGDRWIQRLRSLIGGCFAFIVLMTPESTESDFVSKEIRLAQETGRPVVPLLMRDTHNLLLMDIQYVDGRVNRDPIPELLANLWSRGYPRGYPRTANAGSK